MKIKAILVVALVAGSCGDAFAQLNRSQRQIISAVERELKNVWGEPNSTPEELAEKALQGDPQALYAVSLTYARNDHQKRNEYLSQSAQAGYIKAQLRIVLDIASGIWRDNSLDSLRLAQKYCDNSVKAGYLCATNLMSLIESRIERREKLERDIALEKERRERMNRALQQERDRKDRVLQQEHERKEHVARLAEARQTGVTIPFIPFPEVDKIKYEEAVERAKNNDGEAYYWLANYFLKGEGVEKNENAAGTFLKKAVDAGYAKGSYLAGLYHEWFSLEDERGRRLISSYEGFLPREEWGEYIKSFENAGFDRSSHGGIGTLQMPPIESNDGVQTHTTRPTLFFRGRTRRANTINCCYTNDVATGYVLGLYLSAIKGGLSYATNDIARLKRTIAKCRERIAVEIETQKKAKDKGAAALNLLTNTNEKEKEAAKQRELDKEHKQQEIARQRESEERKQRYEKEQQEREYWSSWPKTLDDETRNALIKDVEGRFNCVFSPHSTNTWFSKNGKALLIYNDVGFKKIDAEGRIVAWGTSQNRADLEEFKWYDEECKKRLESLRVKWSQEHGMTLDEAMRKYEEWQERTIPSRRLRHGSSRPLLYSPRQSINPDESSGGGSLARRFRRQQETEREQAAAEREALQQIQEELRRQREAAENNK